MDKQHRAFFDEWRPWIGKDCEFWNCSCGPHDSDHKGVLCGLYPGIDDPFRCNHGDPWKHCRPIPEPNHITHQEDVREYVEGEPDFHALMRESDLKVDDHVSVQRKVSDGNKGWETIWHPNMDKFIGKTFRIKAISERYGFELINDCLAYYFPPQALCKVEQEQKPQLKHCPKCGAEFCPINEEDEDGEWTGAQQQNCDCDLHPEQQEQDEPLSNTKQLPRSENGDWTGASKQDCDCEPVKITDPDKYGEFVKLSEPTSDTREFIPLEPQDIAERADMRLRKPGWIGWSTIVRVFEDGVEIVGADHDLIYYDELMEYQWLDTGEFCRKTK